MSKAQQTRLKRRLLLCGLALYVPEDEDGEDDEDIY